jgi:hypothetical protein
MEDLATSRDNPEITEEQRHLGLVALDSVPVAQREELGRHLLDLLAGVAAVPPAGVMTRFRRIVELDGAEVILGATNADANLAAELIRSRVMLAHFRTGETRELSSHVTIGVLLTHRRGQRPWDSNMAWVSGPIELKAPELDRLRAFWSKAQPGWAD